MAWARGTSRIECASGRTNVDAVGRRRYAARVLAWQVSLLVARKVEAAETANCLHEMLGK